MVGGKEGGWGAGGGGGGWGAGGGGGMVRGKGRQRPLDCVPVAWQDGEVFFLKFFVRFFPLIVV
jgi:hypothetical protein